MFAFFLAKHQLWLMCFCLTKPAKWRGFGYVLVLGVVIFQQCLGVTAINAQGSPNVGMPIVEVAVVENQNFDASVNFTGRVEATHNAKIITRVSGFIRSIDFTEGSNVTAGETLLTIEKTPYEAAVSQAEAAVASAEATISLRKVNLVRKQQLVKKRTISQAELDVAQANMKSAKAVLKEKKAALQLAKLDLSYTDIAAPIDGRIGRSIFSAGEYVSQASGAIAVVVSQDPMRVTFPVPQKMLLRVMRQGLNASQVKLNLILADKTVYDQEGKILFIDPQANLGTDSVTTIAQFPNPNRLLFDKQLVRVLVSSKQEDPRLAIPQKALLIDPQGSYALVVNDQNIVEKKYFSTGIQDGSNIEVKAGLNRGDMVIISGTQKVRPGITVAIAKAGE